MFKKFLAAMAALMLAIAGFGIATAVPAQAVAGTEVYLAQATPDHGWVKVTNINGTVKYLHEGETANNAHSACPPSNNWRIVVFGPNGSVRNLLPGNCYEFTNPTSSDNPYLLSVVVVV